MARFKIRRSILQILIRYFITVGTLIVMRFNVNQSIIVLVVFSGGSAHASLLLTEITPSTARIWDSRRESRKISRIFVQFSGIENCRSGNRKATGVKT